MFYTEKEIETAKEIHSDFYASTNLNSEVQVNEKDEDGNVLAFEVYLADDGGNFISGYTEYFENKSADPIFETHPMNKPDFQKTTAELAIEMTAARHKEVFISRKRAHLIPLRKTMGEAEFEAYAGRWCRENR